MAYCWSRQSHDGSEQVDLPCRCLFVLGPYDQVFDSTFLGSKQAPTVIAGSLRKSSIRLARQYIKMRLVE